MSHHTIVVVNESTITVDLFFSSPHKKKNNKQLAFRLYGSWLPIFNKWFGCARVYDVQVHKYCSLASVGHCDTGVLIEKCVSHKDLVNPWIARCLRCFGWRAPTKNVIAKMIYFCIFCSVLLKMVRPGSQTSSNPV